MSDDDIMITDTIAEDERKFLDARPRCLNCFHSVDFHRHFYDVDEPNGCSIKGCSCMGQVLA